MPELSRGGLHPDHSPDIREYTAADWLEGHTQEPSGLSLACREPQAMGIQEGVGEENMGIGGVVKISPRISFNESLGDEGLGWKALEGGEEISLASPTLLRDDPASGYVQLPEETNGPVPVEPGFLGVGCCCQRLSGLLPDSGDSPPRLRSNIAPGLPTYFQPLQLNGTDLRHQANVHRVAKGQGHRVRGSAGVADSVCSYRVGARGWCPEEKASGSIGKDGPHLTLGSL